MSQTVYVIHEQDEDQFEVLQQCTTQQGWVTTIIEQRKREIEKRDGVRLGPVRWKEGGMEHAYIEGEPLSWVVLMLDLR